MTNAENVDDYDMDDRHSDLEQLDAQMKLIENEDGISEGMLGESEESSDSNNHIYVRPNQLDWKNGIPRFITNDDGTV